MFYNICFFFNFAATSWLFAILSILIVISGFNVISVANPVYSVLYLILVFLGVSIVLLFLNMEFLALIFIIVYVGAIAVLFLFIVMMLSLKLDELSHVVWSYIPMGLVIGLLLFSEIIILLNLNLNFIYIDPNFMVYTSYINKIHTLSSIEVLGQVLYTYYFIYFLIAGLILLVALLGALLLTLVSKESSKGQRIYLQVGRSVDLVYGNFN